VLGGVQAWAEAKETQKRRVSRGKEKRSAESKKSFFIGFIFFYF